MKYASHPLGNKEWDQIINLAEEGIVTVDADGRTDFINERGASILGYRPEEMIGRPFIDFVDLDNKMLEPMASSITLAKVERYEVSAQSKDGSAIWISVSILPLFGDDGWYQGKLAMFSDITERKREEETLHESESMYRSIFENSIDAIILTNAKGDVLSANPAASLMFGMTEGELIHVGREGLIVNNEQLVAGLKERELKGKVQRELTFKRKDGTTFVGETISNLFIDSSGSIKASVTVRDITERKRVENELQISLERFYQILSSMPYGVLLVTDESKIEFANQAFCDLFRLEDSPKDLLNLSAKAMIEKIRPAYGDPNAALARIEEILIRDRPVKGEDVRMYGDLTVLRDFIPIHLGGKKYGRLWIHVDITDRKRMEVALMKSEASFRTMADGSPNLIWVTDERGRLLFANRASKVFFGIPLGDVEGGDWQNFLHPDDAEAYYGTFYRSLRAHEPFTAEARNKRGDGEWRWLEAHAEPRFSDDGEFLGFVGTSLDITERKSAEEALKESEARYRGLFENLSEAVVVLKYIYNESGEVVDWLFVDVNPALLRTNGMTREEHIGRTFVQLFGAEGIAQYLPAVQEMRAKNVPVVMEGHFDFNDRYFLNTFAPLTDELFIVSSMDITDVKMAQQEAEEYSKKLERSNAELQQFAYVASHDLQEPLRMITAYLSLLDKRAGGELEDKSREYLNYAVDGGTRMKKLIDDLLAYSRVESTGRELTLVDMNEVASQSLADLKLRLADSGASVTHDPMPIVMADKRLMVQLLVNLIGNAVKYRSDTPPHVHISASRGSEDWIFSVRDNGIGFDPQYHDKIFQMFQRLHTREEYPGTGMGLAIAKKIIELHGGRIWAESVFGKGSTFFFSLPIKGVSDLHKVRNT